MFVRSLQNSPAYTPVCASVRQSVDSDGESSWVTEDSNSVYLADASHESSGELELPDWLVYAYGADSQSSPMRA